MRAAVASRRQKVISAVAALVSLAAALNIGTALSAKEFDALIQRVIAETTRGGITIRATRHLEAGTIAGKHRGWMHVETTINSSGTFTWNVIDEGGSERTREKVFNALLEAEEEAARAGRDAAALSLENYDFVPLDVRNGHTRLQLKPRRNDSRLVEGTLTVSADGHPVLLEGKLAKSPSFWVRSVTVLKRFARFGAVSLPVSLESLADVKIVGKSSFSMRYDYTFVNGRRIGHSVNAAARFGPSLRILALHAQLHQAQ